MDIEGHSKPYKRCLRCNRPLEKAESRNRGYGYVCYKKMKDEQEMIEFEKIQLNIYQLLDTRPREEANAFSQRKSQQVLPIANESD